MNLLRFQDILDELAWASGVQLCGHVLRGNNDDKFRIALDFELV